VTQAEGVDLQMRKRGYVVIAFPWEDRLTALFQAGVGMCVSHYMEWEKPAHLFELLTETTFADFDGSARLMKVRNPFSDDGTGRFFRAVPVPELECEDLTITIRSQALAQARRLPAPQAKPGSTDGGARKAGKK